MPSVLILKIVGVIALVGGALVSTRLWINHACETKLHEANAAAAPDRLAETQALKDSNAVLKRQIGRLQREAKAVIPDRPDCNFPVEFTGMLHEARGTPPEQPTDATTELFTAPR